MAARVGVQVADRQPGQRLSRRTTRIRSAESAPVAPCSRRRDTGQWLPRTVGVRRGSDRARAGVGLPRTAGGARMMPRRRRPGRAMDRRPDSWRLTDEADRHGRSHQTSGPARRILPAAAPARAEPLAGRGRRRSPGAASGSGRSSRTWSSQELRVRYQRSVLGFLWTLLNPILMMTTLTLVFSQLFDTATARTTPSTCSPGMVPWTLPRRQPQRLRVLHHRERGPDPEDLPAEAGLPAGASPDQPDDVRALDGGAVPAARAAGGAVLAAACCSCRW